MERLNADHIAINHASVTVVRQGKTVIEQNGGEFWIMHPDGSIDVRLDQSAAEAAAKTWYRRRLGRGSKVGLGEIEWRNP